jgi:hypothetical protein
MPSVIRNLNEAENTSSVDSVQDVPECETASCFIRRIKTERMIIKQSKVKNIDIKKREVKKAIIRNKIKKRMAEKIAKPNTN